MAKIFTHRAAKVKGRRHPAGALTSLKGGVGSCSQKKGKGRERCGSVHGIGRHFGKFHLDAKGNNRNSAN